MPLSQRDRKVLIIGGGVAGAILLGFLLFSLFTGGGEEEALPPTTPELPGGAEPTATLSPSASPIVSFTGRDPFSVPGVLASPTTTSPTSPGTTASPTTTSPTTPGTTPPTQPGGGTSETIGGHTIVLLSIFTEDGEQMAQVEVDGTVYEVSEGETFAGGSFELISISGDCATFRFGDETFVLCVSPQK
jgi:hypothetical protein